MYYKRPLWHIVVILVSLGGIAASVTSAWPMWRRLVRQASALGRRAALESGLVPQARPAPARTERGRLTGAPSGRQFRRIFQFGRRCDDQ
jgi:hypothetical protein